MPDSHVTQGEHGAERVRGLILLGLYGLVIGVVLGFAARSLT